MSRAKQIILEKHLNQIQACDTCSLMERPPIATHPAFSPILLLLPPPSESEHQNNKRLSGSQGEVIQKWFGAIGLADEEAIHQKIYIASVCRCFCGNNISGNLRAPLQKEIKNCLAWLDRELMILQPKLVIPVGFTAISLLLPPSNLASAIGGLFSVNRDRNYFDVIPLPDDSAETISDDDPLIQRALSLIHSHPVFESIL